MKSFFSFNLHVDLIAAFNDFCHAKFYLIKTL